MPEGFRLPFPFPLPGRGDPHTPIEAVIEELLRRRAQRQQQEQPSPAPPPPTTDLDPSPTLPSSPPPLGVPNEGIENFPVPGIGGEPPEVFMPGPPVIFGEGPPVIFEPGPPSARRAPREIDNPYILGAVMTPRIPRIPLPRSAPRGQPPREVPEAIEGEVIPRPSRGFERYGDLPDEDDYIDAVYGEIARRRRTVEGEVLRERLPPNPRPGRSSERGPFGSRRQGEVVIVGRRPPQPPVAIGGVPVRFPRPDVRVITNPPPLPLPRAPQPPRPPRVELPRPPTPTIPTPQPPPMRVPVPSPLPAPLPAPAPMPAPAPPTTPRSQTTTPGRSLPQQLARVLLGALSRATPRSSYTLGELARQFAQPVTGAVDNPLTVTAPDTVIPSPAPLPQPLTALNAASASFSPPRTPTRTRTRECHCDDKPRKRSKRRPCVARGQLVWASGPKKGKPAGSRCIRFGD